MNVAGVVVPVTIVLGLAQSTALAQAPSPIVPKDRPDQAPVTPPPPPQAPVSAQGPTAVQRVTPFKLQKVEVSGSTLPTNIVENAWRPFAGQTVSGTGVIEITDEIIAAYERSDIALYTVLVPTQDFKDGVLRIKSLEGYVERVTVQGDQDPGARGLVKRYLDQLRQERPLTKTTLQRYISLTRDLPGVRSDLRFVTGAETGAVGVIVDVDVHPVQLAMSTNNRGAAFLGRTQVGADLFLNNLVRGGQTRLSALVPTDLQRFQYLGLSHSQLLGLSSATFQANVGHLRTRPRGSDLEGQATSAGIQVSYPVLRSYERDVFVTAGLDGLNANSVLVGSTFSDDRTRAARISVFYAQQAAHSRLSLTGAVSAGLDLLGAGTLVPEVTELNYSKLNGRLAYAREVADRLVVRFTAAGQWSDDRLPASEQFALGGNEFGRAYESAALTGDQGYAASAEFAYRPPGLPTLFQDAEAYGFIDGGETLYLRRAFTAAIEEDLSSIGVGVRATIRQRLALQLEATKPLGASLPALNTRDHRLVFSIRSVW